MRRTFPLALSLVAIAGAMPLHMGDSWVWRVIDLRTNQIDFRSATVMDSVPSNDLFAPGTLWTLAVHDSSTGRRDTATIFANGSSQVWSKGSLLLSIEPLPWNGTDESWGKFAFASLLGQSTLDSFSIGFDGTLFGGWMVGADTASSYFHHPRGIWSDTLGVERFRMRNKEWTLLKSNDRNIALPPLALSIPDSGFGFEWERTLLSIDEKAPPSSSMNIIATISWSFRWLVISRAVDSSGFKVVSIRKTFIDKGTERSETMRLALNPSTKERIPARGDSIILPDEAWYEDWTDSSEGDVRRRVDVTENRLTGAMGYRTTITNVENLVGNTLRFRLLQTNSNIPGQSYSAIRFDLVRIDSNSSPTKVAPRPSSSRSGLTEIARTQPDAQVRWSDIQGRSGSSSLEQFLSSRPTTGVYHLSIRLRDGSTWQGTSLGLR